ncbi:hypothetical protein GCM10023205_39290 [Yinghuangia aomiensis]|uniref:Type I restriction enzyme HindI endonuclease subunit-like C-terminal domain-containing protein n=1 Tax=Yinghuangia aomiensis TaxID=676205 RepID=A0ABP9HFY6_9ACTN
MGDEVLAEIAREPGAEVLSKLKPDWIAREPVRARLRGAIKRLLARHNYPPDQAPRRRALLNLGSQRCSWSRGIHGAYVVRRRGLQVDDRGCGEVAGAVERLPRQPGYALTVPTSTTRDIR